MPLRHETRTADEVRAPAVPRGQAIIVTRYREDREKVALVNPEDLAMLEESHDLLDALDEIEPAEISGAAQLALSLEDRPDPEARLEDPERITEILGL